MPYHVQTTQGYNMTIKIPYKNKITGANTQYRELSPLDRNLVLDKAQEVINLDNELKKYNSPDSVTLNAPNPNMPKMTPPYGRGRNSARSICEGTLDNIKNGTQRDLSDRTMGGLSEAFRVAHSIVDTFEEVEFYEVTTFPKTTVPTLEKGTTLEDLFEVESITVTYRKK